MTIAKKLRIPKAKIITPGKKSFWSENKYIIYAFLVPFALMSVAFAVADVAPFGILKSMVQAIGSWFGIDSKRNLAKPWGTQQILVVDLWHQYFPFLEDLHSKLQSGGSLFWTWSVGMGSNFIAMMSYYLLSPLNFLSVFFPSESLTSYLAVITVIKLALAGMFTAISLKIILRKNSPALVFFSLMFPLCSFTMGYYWCTIWLDSFAMLPLVVAGTVSLLRDGKYKLFIISLALAVAMNYYIGLFICVSVFLTAIGYTVSDWKSMKKSLKDLFRTIVASGIALLLTAPVTIPAYFALQNCYKSTSGMPTKLDINIGADTGEGILDAFVQIIGNFISFLSPTSKEGLPNVSCGILCLVLLAVFFCAKKVRKGEKIFCIITLLFLISSFIFRHLDYMWHGFHYPNMLPYRFSFLVSFLLIYMAYRAYLLMKDHSYFDIAIGALIFSVFILMHFLRKEEDLNKPAAIASIILGAVMIIFLLLYTLKILPKKALTLILCILVTGEMCATAIIGVDTVGTTTTTGYPKENKNVSRILSHIDKWTESETPDIFRTEVTNTQTLNDGSLNGYNGISVFNSMANVNITKYTEFLGCAGWKAGNRYTYYESSPVTNTLLNLRYVLARDGISYTGDYLEEVDRSNNVALYENTAYVNMGFMTNSSLEYFNVRDIAYNPFENQNTFWKMATGIEEPLYTQLTVKDVGHSSDNLSYSKTSEGFYTFSSKDTTSAKHLKFNFYLEEDAQVFAYYYVTNAEGSGNIYINDDNRNSINVKQPFISAVGNKKAGDKISLYCNMKKSGSSTVRALCYTLNQDVFDAGIKKFRENSLNTIAAGDTYLEGTINVKEPGLLYTSIPYEKGWSVTVDGKEAEVVAVGNAMCAVKLTQGEHTVRFSYVPDGFKIGMLAFTTALIILLYMSVSTSNRFRNKAFAKPVVWLCDTSFVKKVKKTDEFEETIEKSEAEPLVEETVSDKAVDLSETEFSEEDIISEENIDIPDVGNADNNISSDEI